MNIDRLIIFALEKERIAEGNIIAGRPNALFPKRLYYKPLRVILLTA
jgi:hypothetical protein